MTTRHKKLNNKRVALVLQGGGSLGVFQAGVFEGLLKYNLTPNWIGGTSIGSINAAIIAGNKPQDQVANLKHFWKELSQKDLFKIERTTSDWLRKIYSNWHIAMALYFGIPNFFMPIFPLPFIGAFAEHVNSLYDIAPLCRLLEKLIDFKYLNNGKIRLSLGATNVKTGEMHYFDSKIEEIRLEHILASCALPPIFPPIKVGNHYYWDGGIYSNTPLEVVLNDSPRVDTLCFMVDLWERDGRLPSSLDEVLLRQEDIKYASRADEQRNNFLEKHNLRRVIQALYAQLPPKRKQLPRNKAMAMLGCTTHMDIVQLHYEPKVWEVSKKIVDFSESTIKERWTQGYYEAVNACTQAKWLKSSAKSTGVSIYTHDN